MRSQVATHCKDGKKISLSRIPQFGVIAGLGAEIPSKTGPVFDVSQDIEQITWHQTIFDGRLERDGRSRISRAVTRRNVGSPLGLIVTSPA
jgi:hypothetical protein